MHEFEYKMMYTTRAMHILYAVLVLVFTASTLNSMLKFMHTHLPIYMFDAFIIISCVQYNNDYIVDEQSI